MLRSRSSSFPAVLFGAALLGAATGLRSQMGMAAVVVGAHRGNLPAPLRHRAARPVVVALAVGELVVDQLPSAPDRTERLGLLARLGLGALSSGILAWTRGRGAALPAAIGAGAAGAASFGGLAARTALARRLPPVVAALTEDVVAAGLATAAVRAGQPRRTGPVALFA